VTEPGDEPRERRAPEGDDGQELEASEVLEGIPEEVKDEIVKRVVRTEASFYRAPVPPPGTLQGYEDVVKGSAKQILDQARDQTDHRMRLESKALDASIENGKRGQWFGFSIAMAVVGVGALAVFTGAGLIGLGLILPGLAALVGVFVYSQRQQQGQLQEGRDAFPAIEEQPSALRSETEGREEDAGRQE
jgi:uncharacterized membrane protein